MAFQSTISPETPVVLFDGLCNLCNGSVQYILRHDKKQIFLFSPLQGSWAKEVRLPAHTDSIVLLYQQKIFTRSDAVLKIATLLSFPHNLAGIFRIVPRFIRDGVYRFIANNRYRWYGKRLECLVPTPDLSNRFLP